MNEFPIRKPNRLKDFDYSQYGYYFITVCTHERKNIFGKIVNDGVGVIHESPAVIKSIAGNIADEMLSEIPIRYPNVKIDQYIIMPNHIHMIVVIEDDRVNSDRVIRESPLRRSLISKIIGYLKMNTTKRIRNQNIKIYDVWQRSYYDHIIRNRNEYEKIYNYIYENPENWKKDKYYIT